MNRITKQKDALLRRLFRTIDVPDDLGPISDIDWKQEVDPTSVSLDEAATDSMWQAMEDFYHSGVHPLVSVCVRRQGKIVLNRSIGYAREDKVASLDTPICMFSASKAVSSVLIHLLAEQGKINLLDPVSYYIPQFASKGKGSISILQLLSHRGGIPGIPEGTDVELLFDQEAALQMVCDAEPDDHQGRIQAYHAVTSGFIFAELIRVTTGMNPQQYLDRYIRKPMGMRYFRYGLTQREKPHAADHAITGLNNELINRGLTSVIGAHPDEVVRITSDPRWFKTIIPSANIYATAEEVTRFFQMLLNNGEWEGKQILQPLTVHRATRSMGKTELDKSLMMPMRYSAGFMLGGNPIGIFGKNTQYAYGHLGFANIFCWADPERDIAVAVMNTGKLALGPHLKTLPALIGTISEQCPPLVDMDGDIPVYHRGRKPRN